MIFLSASIPDQTPHQNEFATEEIVAIRDAVRAIARLVIPARTLVWGGHPSITALIRYIVYKTATPPEHVLLYQSAYFNSHFPADNLSFAPKIVSANRDKASSLKDMRDQMLSSHSYSAGIFIGGMTGVELEYRQFKKLHPHALILPVASTGGAARKIYDAEFPVPDKQLQNNYAYLPVFKQLLNQLI